MDWISYTVKKGNNCDVKETKCFNLTCWILQCALILLYDFCSRVFVYVSCVRARFEAVATVGKFQGERAILIKFIFFLLKLLVRERNLFGLFFVFRTE